MGRANLSIEIHQFSEARQFILTDIKRNGHATIAELSSRMEMTREAVRQHLSQLEHEGWIQRRSKKGRNSGGGRPTLYYSLTTAGEHLFPKHYDALTMEVIDTVSAHLGPDALKQVLASMTEARVREWEPRLAGMSLTERVEALKQVYLKDDAFMEVVQTEDKLSLVENNCPFLNVAQERPVLCSVTVSLLTQLLGHQVVREERFQNGDNRCVFSIKLDQPIDKDTYSFTLEAES